MALVYRGRGPVLPPRPAGVAPPLPRPRTPVYLRDPTRPPPRARTGGPPPVSEQLLAVMRDGRYHHVAALEAHLPGGEWARAMGLLLGSGYVFDHQPGCFRLRRRSPDEGVPLLADVLCGEDASGDGVAEVEVESPVVPASTPPVGVEGSEGGESPGVPGEAAGFDPSGDQAAAGAGPRLLLSSGKDELFLPAAASATMTAAILAKKSSGKTYLGMVLVEELLKVGRVPVVVVDPTGVWAPGLRATADGEPSPYPVLTIGGNHGDVPLGTGESYAGEGRLAAAVVDRVRPSSVILDVSNMTIGRQHEFVADFGEGLFATSLRSPILLVVDEADEFAPQVLTTSVHQKRSLEVLDRIIRRGRTKGLGSVLITQRAAVLNKNVLSQVDTLFLLCMLAPSDLESVSDWLRHVVPVSQRVECLGQLPSLPPGEAFYLRAGASPQFRKFVVRRRDTFDSSYTPEYDVKRAVPVLAKVSKEVLAVAREIMCVSRGEVET